MTTLLLDSASRVVAGGWGTPSTGGPYTLNAGGSEFSVDGTSCKVAIAAAATERVALSALAAPTAHPVLKFRFSLDALPLAANFQVRARLRYVDPSNYYEAYVIVTPAGVVQVGFQRRYAGVTTAVGTVATVAGLTLAPAMVVYVIAEMLGTTMSAWVYPAGAASAGQSTPTITATDGSMTAAGGVGIGAVTGALTLPPPVASFQAIEGHDDRSFLSGRTARYRPSLVVTAPNINTSTDVRALDAAEMAAAFVDDARFGPWLDQVGAFQLFSVPIYTNDEGALLERLVPMLAAHGVPLWLEGVGAWGYNPPYVTGLVNGRAHGIASAVQAIAQMAPIYALGGSVARVTLEDTIERICNRSSFFGSPHKSHLDTVLAGSNNDLRYDSDAAGAASNAIRVRYVVAGLNTTRSIVTSGKDITVNLATDGAGAVKSTETAASIASSISADGPASALVDVSNSAGNDGTGVVTAMGYTSLAYGDDGVNMTNQMVANAHSAFVWRLRQAHPDIRVGIKLSPLMPLNGRAGYDSAAYPSAQMPDLLPIWATMMATMAADGTTFDHVVIDSTEPDALGRRETSNILAQDWLGIIWAIADMARSYGVAAGTYVHSNWGENDPAYVNYTTPVPPFTGSDLAAVREGRKYAQELLAYQVAARPDFGSFDVHLVENWFTYPRKLA